LPRTCCAVICGRTRFTPPLPLQPSRGASPEEIALNIGQSERWVEQQLRLGRLVPEIFAAYVDGAIGIDEAQAYAAAEDADLQRAAWRYFKSAHDWNRSARHIRAWLKVGDRELERLLRFVGDGPYREAGGRFELDLFADGPDRGRVVDEGKLRELAENKLAHLRTDLRQRTGRSDLRFAAEPPQLHGSADQSLAFEPKTSGKGAAKRIELPHGDVIATIRLNDAGEAKVSWWWANRKAKRQAGRDGHGDVPAVPVTTGGRAIDAGQALDARTNYSGAQTARAAVKDEHGLTADGLQVMRSIRRELLRTVMCAEALGGGTLGSDYVIWSQLRQEFRSGDRAAQTGTRGLASGWNGSEDAEPCDVVKPHLEESDAHRAWKTTVEGLKLHDAFVLEDHADAFTAYFLAPAKLKRLAGAVLAGLAMLRSANTPGWRVAVHDRLADLAGATDASLRELWEPTPKFMALFPKLKRLELAQPHVAAESFTTWHKQSDLVLTGATAGALKLAPAWIHPLLSFNVTPAQQSPVSAREAAE